MERIISKSLIAEIVAAGVAVTTLTFMSFAMLEPAVVGAQASDTANVTVNLTVNEEISITNNDGNSINMNNLGVSSSESTGGSSFTVTTNNETGYSLAINAQDDPAMQADGTQTTDFPNYSEATSGTPETWDLSTSGQDYAFGVSAYGGAADAGSTSWGTGSACDGSGSDTGTSIPSDKSYIGFNSTSQTTVGSTGTSTDASGHDTTICFAAGVANNTQPEDGSYSATVVATATTN